MGFENKKVLITGGLGFIGSNLAIRLVELGADITLVDSLIPTYGGNLWNVEPIKDKVRINISDVRDIHSMKYLVAGMDYLFNLAGQTSHVDSMENPETDLAINTQAQLQILQACRLHNPQVRVVFASTRQVYGVPERIPVDETHPLKPVDLNGVHKLAAEQYHRLFNDIYGVRSVILRLTNTYGPRMRVVDAALQGRLAEGLVDAAEAVAGEQADVAGQGVLRRRGGFFGKGRGNVAQESCGQVTLAAVWVDQASLSIFGYRIDGQITAQQVFLKGDLGCSKESKPAITMAGFALCASQRIFLPRIRVKKYRKICADRTEALRDHLLGTATDYNPVGLMHRPVEQVITNGAAYFVYLHACALDCASCSIPVADRRSTRAPVRMAVDLRRIFLPGRYCAIVQNHHPCCIPR